MIFGRTTANRVSRFVDEIPDEHIEKNIPKGYAHKDPPRELGFAHRRRGNFDVLHGVTPPRSRRQSPP